MPRPIRTHWFALGCVSRARSKASMIRLPHGRKVLVAFLLGLAVLAVAAVKAGPISFIPNGVLFPNPGGASQTYSVDGGGIDPHGTIFSEPRYQRPFLRYLPPA